MKKQTKAEKLADKRIEAAYYRTCCGVQIPMLQIPAIWRAVRNGMTPDMTDAQLDELVKATVGIRAGELMRPEPCYACGKRLRGRGRLVGCQDDQTVFVGSDCFQRIRAAGAEGYQPPRGGPRLYLLEFTRHQQKLIPNPP